MEDCVSNVNRSTSLRRSASILIFSSSEISDSLSRRISFASIRFSKFVSDNASYNLYRHSLAFLKVLSSFWAHVRAWSLLVSPSLASNITAASPAFDRTSQLSSRTCRMATSERQVQRITNNWSIPSSDNSRVFSKLPISPSSFTMSPNQAGFALAQSTSDAVVSIHARVCLCHKSMHAKSPRFLHDSKERAIRELSSCTISSLWIRGVVECG